MNTTVREELTEHIRSQIAQTDFRLKGNVVDKQGTPYPQRNAFVLFQKFIRDYCNTDSEPRWIIIPGLRGVGKTTLLAQLFLRTLPNEGVHKFYLSVDEVVRRFNVGLWDVMEVYETLIGKKLERLDNKLFLFLDEVHYDPKWDAALKSFYDRTKNIFIVCTGSSAILLRKQLSADSARRAYFAELYPMSFSEYGKLKMNRYPEKGLGEAIKKALFEAQNADEAQNQLKALEPQVNQYWLGIDKFEIDHYLKFGTLPFSLTIKEDAVTFNQMEQMLQKIVFGDIGQMVNFDKETLNKIYALVYILADSQEISLDGISEALGGGISKDTVVRMLTALIHAGLLERVAPHGAPGGQVKKPYKFLFSTPAFRFLLLSDRESVLHYENFKGKMLEDMVGLYLRRLFKSHGENSLTYDSAKGGADFILRRGKQTIVIEVGFGEKGFQQAEFTLERTKGTYGLIIDRSEKIHKKDKILKVPLSFFLLI
ncbi:MAG: ATP-binding protein [Deltaproteobacteria bacterium]|nr:ATP-binding protein [Deltaproteobacteria bacterium]